jgi:hypothetical protein
MHEEECIRCHGQGTVICDACQGKKKIMKQMTAIQCKECSGTGRVKCPTNCRGGVTWVKDN